MSDETDKRIEATLATMMQQLVALEKKQDENFTASREKLIQDLSSKIDALDAKLIELRGAHHAETRNRGGSIFDDFADFVLGDEEPESKDSGDPRT